jgi:hypothetical protein
MKIQNILQQKHQNGIGSIALVSVIVALVLIVGIGAVVTNRINKPKSQAAVTSTSPTPPTVSPASKQPTSTPQQPAATGNFDIKELGMRLTLPDSLKDLTYSVKDITLPNGKPAKAVYFSTAALTSTDANCSAADAPLGVMQLVPGQYPTGDQDAFFNYGKLLKQFPNAFVTYTSSQGSCTTSKDSVVLKKYQDAVSDFKQSTPSVELVN